MRLPAATKQLSILGETTARLQSVTEETTAVEIIFDALEALGFTKNIRSRLARVIKEESVVVLQYARGEYGTLPVGNLMYRLDTSGPSVSLTGHVYRKQKSIAVDLTKPSSLHAPRSPLWKDFLTVRSFMAIPIFQGPDVIAILSFDSTRKNDLSEKVLPLLRPYQYILGSVLSAKEPKVPVNPSLTKWIDDSRRRRILVLGKDTGEELNRLHKVRDIIGTRGYEGILVKEHPDIPELSNEDKVRTFAGLCRFVLIENTFPAGQIVECKICSTNRIVTAALREKRHGASFMVTDYFKDFDFMEEFTYTMDGGSLTEAVGRALTWAETKSKERGDYFDSLYPWRVKKEEKA